MPVEDHHFIKRLMSYTEARLSTWGKILTAAAFLGAGAASPGTHISAFLLPSFIIALMLTALIFSYLYRPKRLSVRRHLPPPPATGGLCHYAVFVKNLGKKPLRNISVFESTLPYGLYRAPAAPGTSEAIDWLEPGEERKLILAFRVPRRGIFELGDLWAGSSFPLGISRKPVRYGAREKFVVYPKFSPQHELRLGEHRQLQPGGLSESSKVGDSNEFLSTREYRTGDRLRDVHWPSTARAGKLIIKEYIEEYLVRVGIVLDTHWPAGKKPVDFEARVSLCAGIAAGLEKKDCAIDLFTTDEKLPPAAIGRSRGSLDHALELLSCIEGDRTVNFAGLPAMIKDRLHAYSTLFVLLADWDGPRRDLVETLKASGTHVRTFIVRRRKTTLSVDGSVTVIAPKDVEKTIV
jgi:uncharacterized protein (DUF58 family)